MLIVISHTNADFDSLACMYAITRIYPQAVPVLTGSPEPNVKAFLEDYPQYAPKKERQIDLEQVSDIIVVDAPRRNRLANFESLLQRITPILLVDHHPIQDIDITAREIIAEPTGAAITLLLDMLIQKGIRLNPQEASLMALALFEDTGMFTHTRTKANDFQMMAYLMQSGADLSFINQYLQNELSSEQFSLLFQLSKQLEKKEIKGVEITIASGSHPSYLPDLSVITQKLKKVYQLPIIFTLVTMGKRMYMVARSDEGTLDCSKITEYWDGGGHPTAASASLAADSPIEEVKARIFQLVENQFNQAYAVKHIMSSPLDTVRENTPIMTAKSLIMKYNHNSLIVVDAQERLIGIISRDDIERAVHHHLQNATVADFTTTDIITVNPETTLSNLKNLITKTYQRKFPVLQNGNLVGIVTANDLLNNSMSGFGQTVDQAHRFKYSIDTITPILHHQVQEPVIQLLEQIGRLAEEIDAKAFLVGGVVRDLLMGQPIEDYDIVVEGDASRLAQLFTSRFGGRATIYTRFHTATIMTQDKIKIDLASARVESYAHPAALPTVQKSILKHDLYRRDFSINTLAVSLEPENFGHLIHFFSGRRDLSMGIIRILHNLSFIEDPTRII
ncbi:MAG: CBS domain-containing protein, partial [Candidatus Delongbacteria bacterium]|nr:CBS domain-containing protein [Candidatus Delongbacteria bacterium]